MWVMSSFGILMPAIRPPKTVKPGDSKTLQIRARRAKDLDILRALYMQRSLGPTLYTPSMDYEYRAYCEPAAFAMAMAKMVEDVDYLKFKPTTQDKFEDDDLHSCYNAIWGVVMAQLSTKTHQSEYWSKYIQPTGKDLAPVPTYKGHAYFSDKVNATESDLIDGVDPLDDYADYQEWLLLHPSDKTIDLDDGDWAADAAMDAAEMAAELDRLLDEDPPERIDHSDCGHSGSDSARSRCRRRQLREHRKRIDEIRQIVEDAAIESKAAFLSSLPE